MKRADTVILGIVIAIAAIGLIFVWPRMARATDFPPPSINNTVNIALLPATTSNKTSTAYFVESASVHTFQIVTYCTNAVSNIISASLDGTNYFAVATNAVSASSTNGIILIGYRFSWLQANFTQTTANGSTNAILYLGGRQ